jgi:uncharacterized protein YggE
MEKRSSVLWTALVVTIAILLAAVLLGAGILIGRSSTETRAILLPPDADPEQAVEFVRSDNTITVVGKSQVVIEPEIAVLGLGVEICDPEAQAANRKVNQHLETLILEMQQAGVSREDIRLGSFSLYPTYYDQRLTGFCANNSLSITSKDLDNISALMDSAIEGGATNVYGVTFTVEDTNAAAQDGIRAAFEDAERQAQQMAALLHRTVRRATTVNVQLSAFVVAVKTGYAGGGGMSDAQDQAMGVSVTVVYELSD